MYLCIAMMLFQNPIVWLLRIRKRKGYGVHSPFAFSFVTDVLYNKERYYAYAKMDRSLRWWQKGRVRSLKHLLFRLANYQHPQTLFCMGVDGSLIEACKYGSQGVAIIQPGCGDKADMVLLRGAHEEAMHHVGEGTMVVLLNLTRCRDFWKRVKSDERITVTFDLYDVGIAFARKDLNKQDYVINW